MNVVVAGWRVPGSAAICGPFGREWAYRYQGCLQWCKNKGEQLTQSGFGAWRALKGGCYFGRSRQHVVGFDVIWNETGESSNGDD